MEGRHPSQQINRRRTSHAIEFRQADGNIKQKGYLIAWVKAITCLVVWAMDADETELVKMIVGTYMLNILRPLLMSDTRH